MLETLEKAFYIIGDKVVSMGTGEYKKFDPREIRTENVTSELIITPKVPKTFVVETAHSLNQLTKQQIVELAQERFGVDLSIRQPKAQLIEEFLIEQSL